MRIAQYELTNFCRMLGEDIREDMFFEEMWDEVETGRQSEEVDIQVLAESFSLDYHFDFMLLLGRVDRANGWQ